MNERILISEKPSFFVFIIEIKLSVKEILIKNFRDRDESIHFLTKVNVYF